MSAIDWPGETMRLLRAAGLTDWRFTWNRRTHAAGLCHYGKQTIELSSILTPHRQDSDILDTVLHEVAHALAGPYAKHGPEWRAMARKLGARPETCIADTAALGPVIAASRRYVARCDQCGIDVGGRMKRPRQGRTYFHNRCLAPITWRENRD